MKNEIIILESVTYGSFVVMKSPHDMSSEGFLYYTCNWDDSKWTRYLYKGAEFIIIQREDIDIPGRLGKEGWELVSVCPTMSS